MLNKITLISVSTWLVLCNVSQAREPKYPNTPFKEVMTDAPWVVSIDDTIPFLFMLKDGQTDPLDEIHCLAIYDISDGVKRYASCITLQIFLKEVPGMKHSGNLLIQCQLVRRVMCGTCRI